MTCDSSASKEPGLEGGIWSCPHLSRTRPIWRRPLCTALLHQELCRRCRCPGFHLVLEVDSGGQEDIGHDGVLLPLGHVHRLGKGLIVLALKGQLVILGGIRQLENRSGQVRGEWAIDVRLHGDQVNLDNLGIKELGPYKYKYKN